MSHDPLAGCRVVGFDLETTGLASKRHRIIQFAVIGSDVDGSRIHYEAIVNPRRRIPADSIRVHGITNEEVKGKSEFFEHIDKLDELFEDAVIVGHNVRRFDWPFIKNEYLRSGKVIPQPKAIIDTLEIARKLRLPRPHTLGELCHRFDVKLENAHKADADAAATLLLLWRIMEANPQPFRRSLTDLQIWLAGGSLPESGSLGPGFDDLEPFDANGRIRHDGEDLILAFGKHRGASLATIVELDASYLRWLKSPAGPLSREDVARLADWLNRD